MVVVVMQQDSSSRYHHQSVLRCIHGFRYMRYIFTSDRLHIYLYFCNVFSCMVDLATMQDCSLGNIILALFQLSFSTLTEFM
jgi:hypothetical protein